MKKKLIPLSLLAFLALAACAPTPAPSSETPSTPSSSETSSEPSSEVPSSEEPVTPSSSEEPIGPKEVTVWAPADEHTVINSIVDEYQSSMNNLVESRNNNLSSINTEFGYYESLIEELKDLVDENGKIKTGYEERANVITTILSNALGIEIQIVDGVIQKYDELEIADVLGILPTIKALAYPM